MVARYKIAVVPVSELRAHELCESRGGHRGLSVPSSPYGLCGCKANSKMKKKKYSVVVAGILIQLY